MKKLVVGIVLGSALALSTSVFADSIKEYILIKVNYPLVVKGKEYVNADLPVLNYQGNTYVPLKAVGDVLGANVKWNEQLKRVEIGENSIIAQSGDSSSTNTTHSGDSNRTNQPAPSQAENTQPEILKDYLPNFTTPALRYEGNVFLPVRAGSEKYNLTVSYDVITKTISIDKTNIHIIIDETYSANSNGFIYQGISYVKEKILVEASNAVLDFQEKEKDQIEYLELNKPYISKDNGMTVTVTAINVVDNGGFYEYSITYEQKNNTSDKSIDEATFKIYYENGESEPQYGFFGKLMPTESKTRTYTFKATKSQKAFCLEYGTNTFFSKEPSSNTLKWKVQ